MAENDPILASLQAKVAAWQAALDSYKAARALEQGGEISAVSGSPNRAPIELPVGAFRGMTITDAVKLYLQSVRRKQSVQEIADGLRAGGIESTAKDFGPTLRGILHQLKKRGELLRFADGWDLAEAHPTALRNRLAKETSKPARRKGGRKSVKAKPQKPSAARGPSLDERIQVFLGGRPMDWFTPREVADGLKETDMKLIGLALARLIRYGRVAKQDDGRVAAARK